jgi:predicted nucleotide-binding protein
VLHREADEGRTLMEKFEHHADVDYAIILLTPDDVGCGVAEMSKAESERSFEHRARQNVIFEFGFFAGRLQRSRVCCVYKRGVVLPSDLNGLVYKEIQSSIEEVGYALIKEFRAAASQSK